MLQGVVARNSHNERKSLVLLFLFLGIAVFLGLSYTNQEPTTYMASAPYTITMASLSMQSMHSTKAWNSKFTQPASFQHFVQPVSALAPQEPDRSSLVSKMKSELEPPRRREVMNGLALALAGAQSKAAFAVTPIDLKDDRAAKKAGFDITYEARDLDLPQNIRDGLTQARSSVDDTKKRVVESSQRITSVANDVKVAYWSDAGNQLRRQVGTLRFDLNTLAQTKPANEKKAVQAASKKFFADVEVLDLAIREKKMDVALAAYDKAKSSLDAVLKAVV